ncbi:hypothetical protein Cgig2_006907 [Carnegiea gigantea]|uniref:Pentatricopeptide repeat-containing protein n=1 Tax=Carnegiea gigantea TaxID=171969 RepID=A0A9Q1K3P5_9CARY|nr:hypothetical protein Cgig2_006907 [Carnegiea gigantea]
MPRSKAKKLGTLFRSAVKSTVAAAATTSSSAAASAVAVAVAKPSSSAATKSSLSEVRREISGVSHLIYESLYEGGPSHSDGSTKHVSHEISSILCGRMDLESDAEVAGDVDTIESDSDLSWFSNLFNNSTSLRRKELSRERKSKWIFKNTQKHRFDKLVSMCLLNLGPGSTLQVLCKLGRESGLKEYSAFIRGCITTARGSNDERTQVEHILEAYRLFQLMKERGFPIEEDTFGPLLLYLIDMHMKDQFFLFLEIVKDEDPGLHPRLGYYEMLLFIEINHEEKIQELCNDIATGESEMGSFLHENYLLALCERDRKKELLPLLETIDITRVSSMDNITCIFKSLGRLSLETFAELFIQLLKDCVAAGPLPSVESPPTVRSHLPPSATGDGKLERGGERALGRFEVTGGKPKVRWTLGLWEPQSVCSPCGPVGIFTSPELVGISSRPSLGFFRSAVVEDVIMKFKEMHRRLDVELLPESYEKLIKFCCDSLKVHLALDIVDEICEAGLSLSTETLNYICRACEDDSEFILVRRIHSMLHQHNLRPNSETFRSIINLNIRMKDFDNAYAMLKDLERFDLMPTASMYNAIIAGYYREVNCPVSDSFVSLALSVSYLSCFFWDF